MSRIRTIVLTLMDEQGKENEALWAVVAVLLLAFFMEVFSWL